MLQGILFSGLLTRLDLNQSVQLLKLLEIEDSYFTYKVAKNKGADQTCCFIYLNAKVSQPFYIRVFLQYGLC